MNYIDVLSQAVNAPVRRPKLARGPCREAVENSARKRQAASDARYLKALGNRSMTTSQLAVVLSTKPQNILGKLQSMEERGLVCRSGFRDHAVTWKGAGK